MKTNQEQTKSILVINAGSSTIKFSVFDIHQDNKDEAEVLRKTYTGLVDKVTTAPFLRVKQCGQPQQPAPGQLQNTTIVEQSLAVSDKPYDHAMQEIIAWLRRHHINVVAAGHRVAHGGARYAQAMLVNDEVLAYLATLSPLAPLHQPYNLNGSRILQQQFPHILQVVAFDTSFHTTCNQLSQHFALPQKLIAQGVRRYGFHGLSYEYIVSQFDKYLPSGKVDGKIIIAHLGQGASMCAVANKKSVATTLSFSALDGLPMGTRCGNIDPGVLLHLMTEYNMNAKQIETLLYKESGLLGLSGGISSDMRELLASNDPKAKLAVDVFVYKTSAWIGMLAAELQGVDGLVFTAGIGENAAYVREQICERAAWLGVKIDAAKNAQHAATISAADSVVTVHVIPTDEELTIAKDTLHYVRTCLSIATMKTGSECMRQDLGDRDGN